MNTGRPSRAVTAIDLVLVVQGRVGHRHAADENRLQAGDRRQRAGAADEDLDVEKRRLGLLGRVLVRHRPARLARDEAEALLQRQVIDLIDDAVDRSFSMDLITEE